MTIVFMDWQRPRRTMAAMNADAEGRLQVQLLPDKGKRR
jgi:hypothetical protein